MERHEVRPARERRWLLLHNPHRERRSQRRTIHRQRRPAQLRFDDLRRIQKSRLRGADRKRPPRVQAALEWIGKHYTVADNPGQGDNGLYYYYNAFAAALAASKLDAIDADGQSHDWRSDLVAELAERQESDGSWRNSNRRWMENDANLATSFALIALAHCEAPPAQP